MRYGDSPCSGLRSAASRGYTLLELAVVVAIVAVLAAVAMPGLRPAEDEKLDLAAAYVAEAIRHARGEALRTGEGHGLTISQATQQVTVERYDLTTDPISTLGTLTHPIDKQPYDFNVNTTPATSGVSISNSQDVFDYTGLGRRSSLVFDANGTPLWVDAGPTTHLLSDGAVELSYGNGQRLVRVATITGRVSIE
jgi:prepilin-type N-terminal cleavage/methylation domain-containing protein